MPLRKSLESMAILRAVFVAAVVFALTWIVAGAVSSAGAGWALLLIAVATGGVAIWRRRLRQSNLAIAGLLIAAGGSWLDFRDQALGLPVVILGCLMIGWNQARSRGGVPSVDRPASDR